MISTVQWFLNLLVTVNKIAVDKAVLWSTVRDELTRIKNSFVENIHTMSNISYPIFIIIAEFFISNLINPQHNFSDKLGRKKSRNVCQNAYFPCLQGIRMGRSTREEQKTDVWSAKKKIHKSEKKFNALLQILFLKDIFTRIPCLSYESLKGIILSDFTFKEGHPWFSNVPVKYLNDHRGQRTQRICLLNVVMLCKKSQNLRLHVIVNMCGNSAQMPLHNNSWKPEYSISTKVLNKTLIFLQYKTACKQIVQHWFCKSTIVNWALTSLQGRIQDLSEGGARFFRNKRIHN